MLVVDAGRIVDEVSQRFCDHHVEDSVILSGVLLRIAGLSRSHAGHVIVAIDGPCDADVLQARRYAAYSYVHMHPRAHARAWHRCIDGLPGSDFSNRLTSAMHERDWKVISGGTCFQAIGRYIREGNRSFDISIYARPRSVHALSQLIGMHHRHGLEFEFDRDQQQVVDGSAVVMDIIVHGGVVQHLPRILINEQRFRRAYVEAGTSVTHTEKRRTAHGIVDVMCVDRVALHRVLEVYQHSDIDRASMSSSDQTSKFPHGNAGVCEQYLAAIDRELCHIIGVQVEDANTYIHGLAPAPHDLMNNMLLPNEGPVHSVEGHARSILSAKMQLLVIVPRVASRHPHHLHTDMSLGCVHMFPTSYVVWPDGYPIIPAIDICLFATCHKLCCSVHGSLEPLDV